VIRNMHKMIEDAVMQVDRGRFTPIPVRRLTDKSTRLHSRKPIGAGDLHWHGNSFEEGKMLRATLPLIFLILVVGLPVVEAGEAFYGQLLFAMLSILFIGTMVNALLDRPQDDR
jgi:hypothetical protein